MNPGFEEANRESDRFHERHRTREVIGKALEVTLGNTVYAGNSNRAAAIGDHHELGSGRPIVEKAIDGKACLWGRLFLETMSDSSYDPRGIDGRFCERVGKHDNPRAEWLYYAACLPPLGPDGKKADMMAPGTILIIPRPRIVKMVAYAKAHLPLRWVPADQANQTYGYGYPLGMITAQDIIRVGYQ